MDTDKVSEAIEAGQSFVEMVMVDCPKVGDTAEWELDIIDEGGSRGMFLVTVERLTEGES